MFERTTVPDRDKKSNNGRLGRKKGLGQMRRETKEAKRRRGTQDVLEEEIRNEWLLRMMQERGINGRGEKRRGESVCGKRARDPVPIEVEVVLKEAQDREKAGKETIRRRGSLPDAA